MADDDAQHIRRSVTAMKRIVIKIGSRSLVDDKYLLDEAQLASLAAQMAELRAKGREVICISSGAVAAGLGALGLRAKPRDLPSLQAAASIGQARLISMYRDLFALHRCTIGQVLLTHDDLRSRERHLNARNTFSELLRNDAVPIVNENDTVAVDEIRFGDNDRLSALVAMLVRADGLILLTSEKGFLSAPPGHPDSEVIEHVEHITPAIRALAGESDFDAATGGMRTKLEAVEMVTQAGEQAIIAHGRTPNILPRLLAGESLGTLFSAQAARLRGRQRWIAFFDHPQGSVRVDSGAARAVRERGGSLLAIGITAVEGTFQRGSPIRLLDNEGNEFARGLSNYAAGDIAKILGMPSERIAEVLGAREYDAVIHRDNLVVKS